MKKLLTCIVFLSVYSGLFSQKRDKKESEKNDIIETRIEYLSGEEEDLDFTTAFDNFEYYYDHPINLNRVNDLDNLRDLSLVSDLPSKHQGIKTWKRI